ncbi:MAG: septum formation initiator family protein [Actinomycetia bacterium]|nr:septum formation initiator family protein [Actinomycetes bacterium]
MKRLLVVLALAAVAVVILATPVRGWWSQRAEIEGARDELAALQVDNDQLEERLDRIVDPAELELIARGQLGLVREGEESYVVLPPPTAGLVLPNSWPFNRLAAAMQEGQP